MSHKGQAEAPFIHQIILYGQYKLMGTVRQKTKETESQNGFTISYKINSLMVKKSTDKFNSLIYEWLISKKERTDPMDGPFFFVVVL